MDRWAEIREDLYSFDTKTGDRTDRVDLLVTDHAESNLQIFPFGYRNSVQIELH